MSSQCHEPYCVKLLLHERFFARAGDAIFSNLLHRQRGMKITGVAEKVTRKKSPEFV